MIEVNSQAAASRAPSGGSATQRPDGRRARLKNKLKLIGASLLAVGVLAAPLVGNLAPTLASNGIDGVMVTNNMTLPYGVAWLNDGQGGHLWVSDNVQGICRLDGSANASPPFAKTACNGTVKSGGQILVADPPAGVQGLPGGAKYMYVADISSKSISVVRFVFNPNTAAGTAGTLQSALVMNVQNPTSVGGGAGGGRPSGIALDSRGDLYVSYLKSGDLMKITGAQTTTSGAPPIAKVGSTSDGRGVNNILLLNNDLYLAEVGGFGLSKIGDPSGLARVACSASAPCTAASVKPSPSMFPGGLATDGTSIFVGDAPRANTNGIVRWNTTTGVIDTYYSQNVPPYAAPFDGQVRSTYVAPFGLGLGPGGDLYVGDDPTQGLPLPGQAAPATLQGHIWKVPAAVNQLSVSSVTNSTAGGPFVGTSSGSTLGGDQVTIVGKGFNTNPGATTVDFGGTPGTNVACTLNAADGSTTCTTTSPAGTGTVHVRVTVAGVSSPTTVADQFTFVAPANTAISVTSVKNVPGFETPPDPTTKVVTAAGSITGGTPILISGQNLAVFDATTGNATALPTVSVGATPATSVACWKNPAGSADNSTCSATTQPGPSGLVDVQVTLNANTSPTVPGDKFNYITPTAALYAWGITAPKGGAAWLPGNLGGHWWSSDHAQGLCRQDPVPTTLVPNTTLHAINFAVCGSDLVGSAGQAVLDPRPVPGNPALRYVYVPDNAVKSTAVWRLTFDPSTETMVPDPFGGAAATAMTPLADVRTLKPNGMALGPDGNLYVTDLTELNIRQITLPNGDPRSQVITIVAQTGDQRGANGTAGFIGNLMYLSENRGTSFFDVTQCPMPNGAPCGTIKIPLKTAPAGVFVAGTAVDAAHKFVYSSDSPGGASAGIYRYDASNDNYAAFAAGTAGANPSCGAVGVPTTGGPGNKGCVVGSPGPLLITGGTLPTSNAVACSTSCVRPWDTARGAPGSTTGFAFTFGLGTDPSGTLVITEDPSAGARSGRGTMWTVPYIP